MNDFQLGKHEAAIESIKADMATMQADVREIRDLLAEQRGEKRTRTVIFGMAGGGAMTLVFKVLAVKLGMHG